MLSIPIPGGPQFALTHLVLDYNGTLAEDGVLLAGAAERIAALAEHLTVHVVTADTFGSAAQQLDGLPVQLQVLPGSGQDVAKRALVQSLGAAQCVAVGNGRNDALMLAEAGLGIAVIQAEGAARAAIDSADILCRSLCDALDLLLRPKRLSATLRNA